MICSNGCFCFFIFINLDDEKKLFEEDKYDECDELLVIVSSDGLEDLFMLNVLKIFSSLELDLCLEIFYGELFIDRKSIF